MTEVQIHRLDLAAEVDAALAVEAAAFARPPEPFRRESYLRHTTYPAFASVGAMRGSELVGFGYGHTDAPGQWWHDQIAAAMVGAGHEAWLTGSFVLVELHVHPDFQGRGLGRTILTRLLDERGEPRTMLSAHDSETRARRLYRRLGFVDLLTGFRFAGTGRPFAVMGTDLPLAQAS
jgi:ribosomal protein S18 acetylase RimI-like enzyme